MELRVLKYFLMAEREENFTKAANLLHVTQPILSRQLMQLEEKRKKALDEIHFREKQLERMDYLRIKIREEKENQKGES